MKKFAAVSLSFMMMITSVYGSGVTVRLNNEEVSFASQQPVIVEGRTLIPLRSIFESIGYTITWDASTKTAILKSDDREVSITANADSFIANGKTIALDTPAQIMNGSMMLPLRAIGEASGLSVGWDNDTKVVTLTDKQTVEVNTISVGAEMQEFYDNLKSYAKLSLYSTELMNSTMYGYSDISQGLNNGTLAYSKAVEMVDDMAAAYDLYYDDINTYKVSDDCKSAKASLIEIINSYKKMTEYIKNYLNNVYSDDEAYEKDMTNAQNQIKISSQSLSYELSKIDNQYMQTMYKYFDTDKDTEENKANISEFTEDIAKIDSEYPMPAYEDIYNEDNEYIIENIDKNIETIKKAYEGRKAAYQLVNAPDNCKERLELLIASNEILMEMAEAFESYKDYEENHNINPYEMEIENAIGVYDIVSTLAADGKLTRINFEDTEDLEFETYSDESYRTIETEGISQETQDFANRVYYYNAINRFVAASDDIDYYYYMVMGYDGSSTSSTKNVKELFSSWKENQNSILKYLKAFTVGQEFSDVKSAAINYVNLCIQYTAELEKYYAKTISESQFDAESEEMYKKIDAAYDNYLDELSRIDTFIQAYIYDYCEPKEIRTENSEITEFGKAIEEINQKYPIKDDINIISGISSIDTFTEEQVKSIKSGAERAAENIKNREVEYKNVEVPESCKMRAEIIYAADNFILEHTDFCQTVTANDDDSVFNYIFSLGISRGVYDYLMDIATWGEAEELYSEDN